LLPTPHQCYVIPQITLPENRNLELLPLRFPMTTVVADVGGRRKGSLAAFLR